MKLSKWIALLSAVMIFFTGCTLASGAGKKMDEETSAAAQELVGQWEKYLKAANIVDGWMNWVYDSVEKFGQDNSWTSLLKARSACETLRMYLDQAEEIVSFQLSPQQMELLKKENIEAEFVQIQCQSWGEEIKLKQNELLNLSDLLHGEVYIKEKFQQIPDWVTYHRENMQDDEKYLCLSTNYLLLTTGQKDLWDRMPQDYPVIGAQMDQWMTDKNQLMKTTSQVQDQIESRQKKLQELVGTSEYVVSLLKETLETGDVSILAPHIHQIAGITSVFPAPLWLDTATPVLYGSRDENGKLYVAKPGEPLDHLPTNCEFIVTGVSQEDVKDYEAALKEWGIPATGKWDEAKGEYIILSESGSSDMMIVWTEKDTSVLFKDDIPAMVPHVYLLANSLK